MTTVEEKISNFVATLPDVQGVIGYGSGVKEQVGYTEDTKRQIDLILPVKDAESWHRANLITNSEMYSKTGEWFFKKQPKLYKAGASICYMTYIPFEGDEYKIGIIEEADLIDDLINWREFFLAGRMQKNVLLHFCSQNIINASQINRDNALLMGLLLTDEGQSITDLYENICGLSYLGDVRGKVAENPHKVQNIVTAGRKDFDEIYNDYSSFTVKDGQITNINYEEQFAKSIPNLPADFREQFDIAKIESIIARKQLEIIRRQIIQYFINKNKKVSTTQAIKGIITSGPVKTLRYVKAKLAKRKQ